MDGLEDVPVKSCCRMCQCAVVLGESEVWSQSVMMDAADGRWEGWDGMEWIVRGQSSLLLIHKAHNDKLSLACECDARCAAHTSLACGSPEGAWLAMEARSRRAQVELTSSTQEAARFQLSFPRQASACPLRYSLARC